MERLLNYFNPVDYHLDLTISREAETIDGVVRIYGRIMNDARESIKFHAVDMGILSVEYQPLSEVGYTSEGGNNVSKYKQKLCTYNYDGGIITIPITKEMRAELYNEEAIMANHEAYGDVETYQAEVEFIIKFKTKLNHNMQGCYLSTYNYNGRECKLATTQFESHYAREAFPCIDEPAAKAKFYVTLNVPDFAEDDVVLMNTPLVQRRENKFEFARTPRMSIYLLAWVIGPLQKVSGVNQHGVKVATYAALNQSASSLEFANEVAIRALEYYDDKFGIKYPLEKLDQVALPDFEAGAMENWGLVTYRESCMLAEPDASVDTKQSVAVTVTHELSHQWFGNLVTMEWWDDLWLNESFATIMEYYATDALYPELKAWQDFYTGDCVAALRRDSLRGVQAVKQAVQDPAEIATLFDGAIVYAKGARLILMLIHLMGENNFYQGIHDYFEKYQYQNTVGDNLWDALQAYADFNVKEFMHAWISQPGFPSLQRSNDNWNQQRFLIDGTTDDTKWPLPEVKDDMSGHYLIDWSDAEFAQKLGQFDNLNMEQKLRLLIDRMLLAKARNVPTDSLVDILPKFVNEDAPIWSILLDIINDLKIFFPSDTTEEETYREFLRHIIYTRVREIGMKSQPGDDSDEKRLRNSLAVVARFARDEEMIRDLASQYNNNLEEMDAELRGNILMAKMLVAEDEIFEDLFAQYQVENDPEIKDDILGALGAVRMGQNIAKVIDLLEKPDIVRPQDHLYLLIYLMRNPRAKKLALDWVYGHWEYIEKLTGEKSIEDYPRCMANYLNTPDEAEQFNDFFAPMKDNPVLKRTLEMAETSISARLDLIASEHEAVQKKVSTKLAEMEK